MLKVLFVASEAYPFSKSGGLGDVLGALPKAFPEDVDARVILPYYSTIPEELRRKIKPLKHFQMWMSDTLHYCGLLTCQYEGVTFYFIDNEAFFKRPSLYGYYDDGERFCFFCRAVMDSLLLLDFTPDIIHCNDWQTAAVSYLLKHQYRRAFPDTKVVFTIHNIRSQGV